MAELKTDPTPGPEDVREAVRERYAAAARAVAEQRSSGSCCGPVTLSGADEARVFGSTLYGESEASGAPDGAVAASLGCGVPTAVADLHEGEVVLDLGSGAGADVLISARRVGPAGRAIGLDMTDEMLELARRNAVEAGFENVEFVKGYIEEIPLPDSSVDVIVSNCVLNLSGYTGQQLSNVVYSTAIDNGYMLFINRTNVNQNPNDVYWNSAAYWGSQSTNGQLFSPLPYLVAGTNTVDVVFWGDDDASDYFSMVVTTNTCGQ